MSAAAASYMPLTPAQLGQLPVRLQGALDVWMENPGPQPLLRVLQLQLQLDDANRQLKTEIQQLYAALQQAAALVGAPLMLDAEVLTMVIDKVQLQPVTASVSSFASHPPASANAVLEIVSPESQSSQGVETAPGYSAGTGAYAGMGAQLFVDRGGETRLVRGEWFQADLAQPCFLTGYRLAPRGALWQPHAPTSWLLLGSTDGHTWHKIEARSSITYPALGVASFELHEAVAAFTHFRLVVTHVLPGAASCALGLWRLEGAT